MHIFQWLTILLLLFFSYFTHADSPFEILVLHSYSQEYPWTKNQHNGFIAEYFSHTSRDSIISTEHLDSKRKIFDDDYISEFNRYLKVKYSGIEPDIIYTTDDNALSYALQNFDRIFPNSPIVFSGVNNYSIKNRIDRSHVTGVFEKKDISRNIELIKLITPDTKDILIVGDASNTYKAIEVEIKEQLKSNPEIQATFIANHNVDRILDAITAQDSKYIILTTLGSITDSHNHALPLNKIISKIVNAGDNIILSMEDAYIIDGVLGGLATSGELQGLSAARLVLQYLSDSSFEELPLLTDSPNKYIFNYPVMNSISATLPDNILNSATILNAPISFYQRNRSIILGLIIGLAVVLILSLSLFLALLTHKNKLIQSNSIQTQELEQIIFDRTMELSNEKLKLIQAQQIAHIGSYVWELKDNKTTWSDELYNIVGHTSEEFKPTYENYVDCIHPDDRKLFIASTQKILKNKGNYQAEYRIARPDGSVRYVYEQGEVKTDVRGNLLGLVGVIHDITERKQSEDEYLRLQRELGQAQKMEALGQLTGGIAHDFNNILAIISGYTELIISNNKNKLEPKLLSHLENIKQASTRASDLVSKMMVFSRNDVGVKESIDLIPLIKESIKMLRSVIPSSIDIKYTFDDKLPNIMMDPIQIHQIMMNLSINAKDAMEGSGLLTIHLGWKNDIATECQSCHKHIKGNWVALTVADTGCGMESETVNRIFEPFYTTKKVGQGTGMGMSVLNSIIENHGGHILIDTEVGSGTSFQLLFPPAPANYKSTNNEFIDTVTIEHAGEGQKILIVDDEPSITGYMTEMLESHGYICFPANQSPQALHLVKQNPELFQLIITDQTMPQLLGMDMIRKIWNINPEIPVILTTGHSDAINRQQAEKLGLHFMDKPINNSKLLAMISELLSNRTQGNAES